MNWYGELDKWTADYLPEMEYEKDVPLSRYTSFRIGGAARRMAFPRSGEELILLVSRALECGARPFVLGNGTNVLFPDRGVERLVVCTRDMNGVEAGEAGGEITAQCGATLAKAAVFAQKTGLSGLEFAHGIPGSTGGGVTMNAGAYGGEMAQVIKDVTVLSFGFKNGLPPEADMVVDVRFLPNPYYVPELKRLTGLDEPVRAYVMAPAVTEAFWDKLAAMVDFLLPQYRQEGRTELVLAVGCTGGRHRSVAMAHRLAAHIGELGFSITESHRDMGR